VWKSNVRVLVIEEIDSVDLPVDRKLNWSLLFFDKLIYGFRSILRPVELRDQPARQVFSPLSQYVEQLCSL
jgi:hypothetical protein